MLPYTRYQRSRFKAGSYSEGPLMGSLTPLKRRPLLFIVTTCILGLPPELGLGISPQQPSVAAEHAKRGLQYAERGELKKAEAELRRAVELSPDDPFCLATLGGILGMQQRLREGSHYFKKALRLDPANTVVRRNLATNQWKLGEFQEAKENLQLVLKKVPDDKFSIWLLGMVDENLREYDSAAKLLGSVQDMVRRSPDSVAALARSYYNTGQKERARDTLAILRGHPAGSTGIFLGGQVAAEASDFETAEKLFSSITSTFPDRVTLGYNIALVQFRARRFQDAEKTLRELIDTGYETSDVYSLLGMLESKREHHSDALASYSRAAELNPRSPVAILGMASELRALGMSQNAVATFEKGIKLFPREALLYQEYGALLLKLTKPGDNANKAHVESLLNTAINLNASLADPHFQLGNLARREGRTEDALREFEIAARLDPRPSKFHYALASVCRRLGRTEQASQEFRAFEILKAGENKSVPLPPLSQR